MNILILALSNLNFKYKKINYYKYKGASTEIEVQGEQTNEPVAKLVVSLLKNENEKLDKIIILATKETKNIGRDSDYSTLAYFKKCMNDFMNSNSLEIPEIKDVSIEINYSSEQIFKICMEIVKYIDIGSNVYVDTTGGFRDAIMTVVATLQIIKTHNIKVKDIFYVDYITDNSYLKPCTIKSNKELYSVFDIVSGLDEFLNYSSTKKLEEFYKDSGHKQIKELINALSELSDEMEVCRVSQAKDCVKKLAQAVEKYESSCVNNPIINQLVIEIRKKYDGILKKENIGEIDFIEWSFNNDYISQTFSYYYETVPKILVDMKAIYPRDDLVSSIKAFADTRNENRAWQYYFINTYFAENRESSKIKIKEFKEFIKGEKTGFNDDLIKLKIQKALKQFSNYKLNAGRMKLEHYEELSWLSTIIDKYEKINYIEIDKEKLVNKISTNNNIIKEILGIANIKTVNKSDPDEYANFIVKCIDNKDILSDIDNPILCNLLSDYFYIKNQRNNVLHVGECSDSPGEIKERFKTSIKNLKDFQNKSN